MIKFKVFEVMAQRGYRTRKALAEATGINQSNLGRMIKGDIARLDTSTLNNLCRVLNCQPGDIFEYIPDEEAAQPKKKARR